MKILKKLISKFCIVFIFICSNLNADMVKNGTELLLTQYDWGSFWEEFTISPSEWIMCKTSDPKKGMFGMAATMSQPLYLADVTTKNNKVNSIGMTLGNERLDKSGSHAKGGLYVNLFRIPLMSMLLKKTSKGLFAFENSKPALVYLGMLDFKKWNDPLAASMIPERVLYSNLKGALASVASCTANTVLDSMSGKNKRSSGMGKALRSVVDFNYYSIGCLGMIPPGTVATHSDPLMTAKLVIASVLSDMHSKKGVAVSINVKHRVRSPLNGHSKKILCHGIINPIMPPSQYTMQLLYPTVGPVKELGISPIEYSFKGRGQSGKNVIYIINERRDYAAYAYQD